MTDASAYISYITRFTEESFATLVALIFIKKAISQVSKVNLKQKIILAILCTGANVIAKIFTYFFKN
jgi:hypothetical protein